MRKNYKTSKHPNKIHIIQKYAKQLTFKNCVQIKKGRFAYLRWKIRNKICKTRMLTNRVLWWPDLL
jgi:hypothetical protein